MVMSKNKICATVFAMVVLVNASLFFVDNLLLDGFRGLVLSVLFDAKSTEYAPLYTDAAFGRIAIGDTKQIVVELLGEPLDKGSWQGVERWWYSRSNNDTHYRLREIQFRENHVVKKIAYFYVD
jgi:outer membrane protein assembly factor BamE (lipoprotein component of BamABCDE complex)